MIGHLRPRCWWLLILFCRTTDAAANTDAVLPFAVYCCLIDAPYAFEQKQLCILHWYMVQGWWYTTNADFCDWLAWMQKRHAFAKASLFFVPLRHLLALAHTCYIFPSWRVQPTTAKRVSRHQQVSLKSSTSHARTFCMRKKLARAKPPNQKIERVLRAQNQSARAKPADAGFSAREGKQICTQSVTSTSRTQKVCARKKLARAEPRKSSRRNFILCICGICVLSKFARAEH